MPISPPFSAIRHPQGPGGRCNVSETRKPRSAAMRPSAARSQRDPHTAGPAHGNMSTIAHLEYEIAGGLDGKRLEVATTRLRRLLLRPLQAEPCSRESDRIVANMVRDCGICRYSLAHMRARKEQSTMPQRWKWTDQKRRAFDLSHRSGLTQAEIAAQVGVTRRTLEGWCSARPGANSGPLSLRNPGKIAPARSSALVASVARANRQTDTIGAHVAAYALLSSMPIHFFELLP